MKIAKFSNWRFLRFFSLQKHEMYQQPSKFFFFILYDITYIRNRGNCNNYLNWPINLNIMRYFFWRVYIKRRLRSSQYQRLNLYYSILTHIVHCWLVGWLVVLRIYVRFSDLSAISRLKAGDLTNLWNCSGAAGNRIPASCSANQEFNHYTMAAPNLNWKFQSVLLKLYFNLNMDIFLWRSWYVSFFHLQCPRPCHCVRRQCYCNGKIPFWGITESSNYIFLNKHYFTWMHYTLFVCLLYPL